MDALRRSFLALARLVLVAAAVTACGTSSLSTTTLVAGWERHFTIDWTVEPEQGGAHRVRGFVTGQHGEYAEPVRLLAQALDSSGAVVGHQIVWLPGGVNGSQRAYFEIRQLPSAAQYRVSVWEYTFLQTEGWL